MTLNAIPPLDCEQEAASKTITVGETAQIEYHFRQTVDHPLLMTRASRLRAPSFTVILIDMALNTAFSLARELEIESRAITDGEILGAYKAVRTHMQSNCDSMAQGMLVLIACLCAHRKHLTPDLLPGAMESLYYLGVEDIENVTGYIKWLADYDQPYLGKPTITGRSYLLELANSPEILRDAFRRMYELQEPNDELPLPRILKSDQNMNGDT